MPIIYVNPAKKRRSRRHKVSGRAKVGKLRFRRNASKVRARKRRKGSTKKRSSSMARRRSSRNKKGRFTKVRRRRRSSAARLGHKRRKRRAGGRKRRSHKRSHSRRKRRSHRRSHKRSRRRGRATAARLGHRRRRRKYGPRKPSRKSMARRRAAAKTLVMFAPNPRRRRRRRRRSHSRRRRSHRRRYRRNGRRRHSLHRRRYRRNGGYRRNPGGMLMDLVKRAIPVLIGLYGSRLIVNKLGPMIPGVSALGTFQGPALSVGAVFGIHYGAKYVAIINKHKSELMLGAGLNALDSLFSAFAPASIKAMIGVGDVYDRALAEYVATGEYVGLDGTPLSEQTMSNYIAVDGMEELGVDEALGIEEELGVDEALGHSWDYGGLPGGIAGSPAMQKQVPSQAFAKQIPQRSFTKPVPNAGGDFDSAGQLYTGTFSGGFGN